MVVLFAFKRTSEDEDSIPTKAIFKPANFSFETSSLLISLNEIHSKSKFVFGVYNFIT